MDESVQPGDNTLAIISRLMNTDENKKNAIAFYKIAYGGNPQKAVELYVGNEYIQHNPDVADGRRA